MTTVTYFPFFLSVILISHCATLLGCCGCGNICLDEKSSVCVCVSIEPATIEKEAVPCCQLNGCLQRPLWKESLPLKLIHGEINSLSLSQDFFPVCILSVIYTSALMSFISLRPDYMAQVFWRAAVGNLLDGIYAVPQP